MPSCLAAGMAVTALHFANQNYTHEHMHYVEQMRNALLSALFLVRPLIEGRCSFIEKLLSSKLVSYQAFISSLLMRSLRSLSDL